MSNPISALFSLLINKNVPPAIKAQRQHICNGCSHRISLTNQCSQCGCFLHLKTEVKTEHCPLFKWNVYVG